jgi:hypothetical protein
MFEQTLFHVTSWFSWEDQILPSGVLLPRAITGERGITKADQDLMWVSGVSYARSRYVFLAPEHLVEPLARNYGRRSLAIVELPIDVLDGRRWLPVEVGRRRASWSTTEALTQNLHQVEMILTPDPIPLSAVRSVERRDPSHDEHEDPLSDHGRNDYDGWLEDWWDQLYLDG